MHHTLFLHCRRAACWLAFLALTGAVALGAAPKATFVRPSPRDPRYFELSDGTPYVPIGFNLVPCPRERDMESVLDTMAANKVNYCRIWLDQPPMQVEHQASGVYDEARVQTLRRFLDLAAARGIRVKLCTEHFRNIPASPVGTWSDRPLHNKANGGPYATLKDFFETPQGQEQFRRKLAFYQAHLGDHPAVFAWELWNEMNAVNVDWYRWTAAMLPELHRLFPKNMAVQSLGSFDRNSARQQYRKLCTLETNDVAQVHRYLDPGADLEICHGPFDLLAADAVRELLAFKLAKPVMLAESGAVKPKHTGCSELYAKDKDGMMVHDVIFAPFFTGAAATGQTWWWPQALKQTSQWHHFARFARAIEGIDPPAEHFEPVMVPHERLRVYLLKGRGTLLAWCRDSKNDWHSELELDQAPEILNGMKVDLGGQVKPEAVASVRAYSPWDDTWSELKIDGSTVTLPLFKRSVVIKVVMKR